MADLYTQNKPSNSCAYDSRIFVDKNAATIYKCGICHNVCRNAVEIVETNENDKNVEGSLFCYQCIAQSNLSNSYHASKFIQNTINNLIVICPYHASIESLQSINVEGDAQMYCEWEGKLLNLHNHIEAECLKKPFTKCPFDCCNSKKQITRNHFKENQTQHIDSLLSMVQSLNNQLSQCQNHIIHLQHQVNHNKQEMNSLKKQINKYEAPQTRRPPPPRPPLSISSLPPLPPPPPTRNNASSISDIDCVKHSINSIGSDFKFQLDHPNISVLANGRSAVCMETNDILIEFGKCLITNKPSHKSRNRERDSSVDDVDDVDDLFADPDTLNVVLKEENVKKEKDRSIKKNKRRRRFTNPFKNKNEKKYKHRKTKSEVKMKIGSIDEVDLDEVSNFSMSTNNLNECKCNTGKVTCWECYLLIEDCNEFGNIGIAMIKDTNDGISILYKNGDYIDVNKKKTTKNGFIFEQGNMIKISVKWNSKGFGCFADILNIDTKKSVIIDNLDTSIKFGFILNQSRITVIDQYWK